MIQLSSPALLLEREKLVQVSANSPNKSIQAASYKLALVFNYPETQLPPTLKEMTEKLITACRFKPEEALYINQASDPHFSLSQLSVKPNISLVLAFGNIRLSRNITVLAKHQPYQIGGLKIIQTDSLENLEKNLAAKKELWGAIMRALNLQ